VPLSNFLDPNELLHLSHGNLYPLHYSAKFHFRRKLIILEPVNWPEYDFRVEALRSNGNLSQAYRNRSAFLKSGCNPLALIPFKTLKASVLTTDNYSQKQIFLLLATTHFYY